MTFPILNSAAKITKKKVKTFITYLFFINFAENMKLTIFYGVYILIKLSNWK